MKRRVVWIGLTGLVIGLPALWVGSVTVRCAVWGAFLTSESLETRSWAVGRLEAEADPASFPVLLRAAHDEDARLAPLARDALTRRLLEAPDAVPELLRLCGRSDEDAWVAAAIVKEVNATGSRLALPLLRSSAPGDRRGGFLATQVLARWRWDLGDREVRSELMRALESESDARVRTAAVVALGSVFQTAPSATVELLLPALEPFVLERAAAEEGRIAADLCLDSWRSIDAEEREAFAGFLDQPLGWRNSEVAAAVLAGRYSRGLNVSEEVARLSEALDQDSAGRHHRARQTLASIPSPEILRAFEDSVAAGDLMNTSYVWTPPFAEAAAKGYLRLCEAPGQASPKEAAHALDNRTGPRGAFLRVLVTGAETGAFGRAALAWGVVEDDGWDPTPAEGREAQRRARAAFALFRSDEREPPGPAVCAELGRRSPRVLGPAAVAVIARGPLFQEAPDAALESLRGTPLGALAEAALAERAELRALARPQLIRALDDSEAGLVALSALGPEAPTDKAQSLLQRALEEEDPEPWVMDLAIPLIQELDLIAELAEPLVELSRRGFEMSEETTQLCADIPLEAMRRGGGPYPRESSLLEVLEAVRKVELTPIDAPWREDRSGFFASLGASQEPRERAALALLVARGLPPESLPELTEPLVLAEVTRQVAAEVRVQAMPSSNERALRLLSALAEHAPEARAALVQVFEVEQPQLWEQAREALRHLVFDGLPAAELRPALGEPTLMTLDLAASLGPLGRELAPWVLPALELRDGRGVYAMWALCQVDPSGEVSEPALLDIAQDAGATDLRRACAVEALSWLTALSPEARRRLGDMKEPPALVAAAIARLEAGG